MVVGIDGGHVEWSPLRHRHFPNEIRDAILTLLLCHRFRRDSPIARLSKDELLHLCSFVPRQWPTPCFAAIRISGVACSGGFVRATPATAPPFDDCGHSVLICRAHFYHMQHRKVALTGGPSWHRCLPECTPWWVLHWAGAAQYRSATFWQRHFWRGMVVEDGVIVLGNAEAREVAVLQRSSGAQEERAHATLVPRIVREEDVGRWAALYQYLGERGEPETFRIVYVRDNEVGVTREDRKLIGFHRQDLCLCLSPEEALRLVVQPTPGRKRSRK